MNGITKIVKYFEESCLLIKGLSQTIKHEAKNKNENFSVRYYEH